MRLDAHSDNIMLHTLRVSSLSCIMHWNVRLGSWILAAVVHASAGDCCCIQVMNPVGAVPGPASSAAGTLSAVALSHVSKDAIEPILSASTPQQLALIFQRAGAQKSASAPASAVQPAPGESFRSGFCCATSPR